MNDLLAPIKHLLNLPVNASQQGGQTDNLLFGVHILMTVLFVGWGAYFITVLLKFRKSRNPKADHHGVRSHASTYLEITVAAIEAALLVGLALPIWAKTTDQFPKSTKPGDVTTIKVIAQQFIWNGLYPGTNGVFARQDREFVNSQNPFGYDTNDVNYKSNFSVKGELYVPVGKPVIVQISSLDVIHCFSCKPMRTVQDAIPGMMIPAWFIPAKEGVYEINCAQLCGASHYAMRGNLHVVSQAEYDTWVAKHSGG